MPALNHLPRRQFMGSLATIVAAPLMRIGSARAQRLDLGVEGSLPSFGGAVAWLNSTALGADELKGKVVLVEFWTYTCINWLRTLPYVRAWAHRYKDQGLTVIGVHTPEFAFEKKLENVRRAVVDLKVDYPVAVDSDYAVWKAFNNEYWPALYFIDARGRIRHHAFGEGEYDISERVIQQLLMEAGAKQVGTESTPIDPTGFEVQADWADLKSSENYVGYARTEGFVPAGGAYLDRSHRYTVPEPLELNHWALDGDWTIGKHAVSPNQPNGKLAYRFHARDLHLVMGPASPGTKARFRVSLDGQPPGGAHGFDVDAQGNGTVSQQRLHQLIRQPGPILDRQFEIEFVDTGAELFCFTFG